MYNYILEPRSCTWYLQELFFFFFIGYEKLFFCKNLSKDTFIWDWKVVKPMEKYILNIYIYIYFFFWEIYSQYLITHYGKLKTNMNFQIRHWDWEWELTIQNFDPKKKHIKNKNKKDIQIQKRKKTIYYFLP